MQEQHQRTFSIGEVAEILKTSVETIRLYERRGLLLTLKAGNSQRVFSESDVERIKCIRTAINEHKISIEGIRRMQSFVPCWDFIQCPLEDREKCPAYLRSDAGCWTYKDKQNDCATRDCRSCMVYQLSSNCDNIKSLIHHDVMSSQPKADEPLAQIILTGNEETKL
jgi:MerR family transcriptional regulator/heat shock protein HspR